jgi:TolA-binding protein
VKLGPSIPVGYYSWGVPLAKHGDFNGAAAKFKDANQKGPTGPIRSKSGVMYSQSGARQRCTREVRGGVQYAQNWRDSARFPK